MAKELNDGAHSFMMINGDLRFYEVICSPDCDRTTLEKDFKSLGVRVAFGDTRGCLVFFNQRRRPDHEEVMGRVEHLAGVLKVIPCPLGTPKK